MIDTDHFKKIKKLYPGLNFDKELEEKPELAEYIRSACAYMSNGLEDPNKSANVPKLDKDFSKYFVVNNLPKCDEAKSKKLKLLLTKILDKKGVKISENEIEMPFNEAETVGCAFIKLDSEEKAKMAAALLDGHKLDQKHTFAAA